MNQAIGVMDSGIGGLTVTAELMRQLPNETIYYFGDSLRCPYGPRDLEQVKQFTIEIAQFLMTKNVKMLVIACNTATAAAIVTLNELLPIPVVGVIAPGARTAIQTTVNNQVLVLGTEGTIKSQAYNLAIHKINPLVHVDGIACSPFVPFIENKQYQNENDTEKLVNEVLNDTKKLSVDTVILGCTHYPLISSKIQQFYGKDVQVISSSRETAREVSTVLTLKNIHHLNSTKQPHRFFVTSEPEKFKQIAKEWLNLTNIDVEVVTL